MATTTMNKNGKKDREPQDTGRGKLEKLPEPIIIDGFFLMQEGNSLCGTLVDREEGQYGFFYKVRTTKPCKVKSRDEDSKTAPVGSIVAINENAKLRQLNTLMKSQKGGVYVEILVLGPKDGGRGWDLDVGHRAAF